MPLNNVSNTVYKCTGIFNGNGVGWTETLYAYATGVPGARVLFEQYLFDRDDLLGAGYTIPYNRATNYNDRRVTSFANTSFISNSGFDADTAWNALLIRLTAANGMRRSLQLRGWPDDCFKKAEFAPIPSCQTALTRLRNTLVAGGFAIVGQDPTKAVKPFVSISGTGLVTFAAAHGYADGTSLYLVRAKTSPNRTIRGTFTVQSSPSASTLQLNGWVEVGGAFSGSVREKSFVDSVIVQSAVERAVWRKVGRPFGLSRGRSRRRV